MKKIKLENTRHVIGGVPLIQMGYGVLGCVLKVGISYKNDPEMTSNEEIGSCVGGVINSLNPAFGVTNKLFANGLTRYAAGLLWSDMASRSEDKCKNYLDGLSDSTETFQINKSDF